MMAIWRITVPGVRRVLVTKMDASTTTAVLQTICQLTKILEKDWMWKGNSGRSVWGSEAVLGELESLCGNISLQVGWILEMCTKPSDDAEDRDIVTNEWRENAHGNPNESNGVLSLPTPSANNFETSAAACSNQLMLFCSYLSAFVESLILSPCAYNLRKSLTTLTHTYTWVWSILY